MKVKKSIVFMLFGLIGIMFFFAAQRVHAQETQRTRAVSKEVTLNPTAKATLVALLKRVNVERHHITMTQQTVFQEECAKSTAPGFKSTTCASSDKWNILFDHSYNLLSIVVPSDTLVNVTELEQEIGKIPNIGWTYGIDALELIRVKEFATGIEGGASGTGSDMGQDVEKEGEEGFSVWSFVLGLMVVFGLFTSFWAWFLNNMWKKFELFTKEGFTESLSSLTKKISELLDFAKSNLDTGIGKNLSAFPGQAQPSPFDQTSGALRGTDRRTAGRHQNTWEVFNQLGIEDLLILTKTMSSPEDRAVLLSQLETHKGIALTEQFPKEEQQEMVAALVQLKEFTSSANELLRKTKEKVDQGPLRIDGFGKAKDYLSILDLDRNQILSSLEPDKKNELEPYKRFETKSLLNRNEYMKELTQDNIPEALIATCTEEPEEKELLVKYIQSQSMNKNTSPRLRRILLETVKNESFSREKLIFYKLQLAHWFREKKEEESQANHTQSVEQGV